jgi:hypothetical protein
MIFPFQEGSGGSFRGNGEGKQIYIGEKAVFYQASQILLSHMRRQDLA